MGIWWEPSEDNSHYIRSPSLDNDNLCIIKRVQNIFHSYIVSQHLFVSILSFRSLSLSESSSRFLLLLFPLLQLELMLLFTIIFFLFLVFILEIGLVISSSSSVGICGGSWGGRRSVKLSVRKKTLFCCLLLAFRTKNWFISVPGKSG